MDLDERCNALINDERFYEKKKFFFTKTWGMLPENRKSINTNTEKTINDVNKFLDPLSNGVSFDLIDERTGGTDSRMFFSDKSLFKLNSVQLPSILESEIIPNKDDHILTKKDFELIQKMHNDHKNNDYTMNLYVDKSLEKITVLNSKYVASGGELSFKHKNFETPGYKPTEKNDFFAYRDQRIPFQVRHGLVEQKRAHDTRDFHQSVLSQQSRTFNPNNEKNKIHEELTVLPKAKLVLLVNTAKNLRVFKPIAKKDITTTIEVKDLTNDQLMKYEVLDRKKFIKSDTDNIFLVWGIELSDLHSGNGNGRTGKWLPIIKLTKKSTVPYNPQLELMLGNQKLLLSELSLRRFYTRLQTQYNTNSKNIAFANKIFTNNPILTNLLDTIRSLKDYYNNILKTPVQMMQMRNGVLDTDTDMKLSLIHI